MLTLKKIRKEFPIMKKKNRIVLDELDLEVSDKISVAIEGRSGSGKTTLLKIICGLDRDFGGEYLFEGEHMELWTSTQLSKFRQENVAIITQHFDLLDDRNVYENIALAVRHKKYSSSELKKRISLVLNYVGLDGYEKKSIKELSGGELQRVGIARALVKEAKLIVADEPTGALDEVTRDEILNLFLKMKADGYHFIIVTHDKIVSSICDERYYLKNGKLLPIASEISTN